MTKTKTRQPQDKHGPSSEPRQKRKYICKDKATSPLSKSLGSTQPDSQPLIVRLPTYKRKTKQILQSSIANFNQKLEAHPFARLLNLKVDPDELSLSELSFVLSQGKHITRLSEYTHLVRAILGQVRNSISNIDTQVCKILHQHSERVRQAHLPSVLGRTYALERSQVDKLAALSRSSQIACTSADDILTLKH